MTGKRKKAKKMRRRRRKRKKKRKKTRREKRNQRKRQKRRYVQKSYSFVFYCLLKYICRYVYNLDLPEYVSYAAGVL